MMLVMERPGHPLLFIVSSRVRSFVMPGLGLTTPCLGLMDVDNQYDPGLMAHSSPGRLVGAVITIKGQELQGGPGPGQTRHSSSHYPSQPDGIVHIS